MNGLDSEPAAACPQTSGAELTFNDFVF